MIRDFVDVLRRRWSWSLLALALVVASVVAVFSAMPASRTYTASVLLLPPEISKAVDPSSPDYTKSNPLFFLGTLGQARDILIGSLTAKDVQAQIEKDYPGVSYQAAQDVLGTGPIVIITVEGPDEARASAALDSLLISTGVRLETLQTDLGIESNAQISAHVLSRDAQPTTSRKGQIRAALVAGGGLALLLLFVIGIGDALLTRRRKASRPDAAPD